MRMRCNRDGFSKLSFIGHCQFNIELTPRCRLWHLDVGCVKMKVSFWKSGKARIGNKQGSDSNTWVQLWQDYVHLDVAGKSIIFVKLLVLD